MDEVREAVRTAYAKVAREAAVAPAAGASCCAPSGGASCCSAPSGTGVWGASLYNTADLNLIPANAANVSLGCGNPVAIAELHPGESVLDLGSGGGIDVLLSAQRVGPTGFAYGVDMTDEMLDLAQANADRANATNVEFLKGTIEDLPLSDSSVDVEISNCVINLSTDKPAVFSEMFRVLRPGGRIGISDVIADDDLTPEQRAERGTYTGCIAGALSFSDYLDLLASGFHRWGVSRGGRQTEECS